MATPTRPSDDPVVVVDDDRRRQRQYPRGSKQQQSSIEVVSQMIASSLPFWSLGIVQAFFFRSNISAASSWSVSDIVVIALYGVAGLVGFISPVFVAVSGGCMPNDDGTAAAVVLAFTFIFEACLVGIDIGYGGYVNNGSNAVVYTIIGIIGGVVALANLGIYHEFLLRSKSRDRLWICGASTYFWGFLVGGVQFSNQVFWPVLAVVVIVPIGVTSITFLNIGGPENTKTTFWRKYPWITLFFVLVFLAALAIVLADATVTQPSPIPYGLLIAAYILVAFCPLILLPLACVSFNSATIIHCTSPFACRRTDSKTRATHMITLVSSAFIASMFEIAADATDSSYSPGAGIVLIAFWFVLVYFLWFMVAIYEVIIGVLFGVDRNTNDKETDEDEDVEKRRMRGYCGPFSDLFGSPITVTFCWLAVMLLDVAVDSPTNPIAAFIFGLVFSIALFFAVLISGFSNRFSVMHRLVVSVVSFISALGGVFSPLSTSWLFPTILGGVGIGTLIVWFFLVDFWEPKYLDYALIWLTLGTSIGNSVIDWFYNSSGGYNTTTPNMAICALAWFVAIVMVMADMLALFTNPTAQDQAMWLMQQNNKYNPIVITTNATRNLRNQAEAPMRYAARTVVDAPTNAARKTVSWIDSLEGRDGNEKTKKKSA